MEGPRRGSGASRSGKGLREAPRGRVFEEWQGNERFFCGGRCIGGPNWKSLIGTSCLILLPLAVYILFVGEVLWDEISVALPAAGVGLGLLALFFLFKTGCMDPGILPRQEPDEEYRAGRKPKSKEMIVNGHKVLVRYNETCHFYQPPRAHHCSVNDNCIEKFDHHCPWVGTTIGLRNYRFFLMFIFTGSLLCLYVCGTAVLAVKLEYDQLRDAERDNGKGKPSVWEALEEAPAAVALAAYTVLFFLFVGGLSFFHIYLVSTNQTTYENFRYGYERARNPYDQGCVANWASVWCIKTPQSKVSFRAPVVPKRPPPPNPGLQMSRSSMSSGYASPAHSMASASRSNRPHTSRSRQSSRAPREMTMTIDVEMGPLEIRHVDEGGGERGKLQQVSQYSSSDMKRHRAAGASLPPSRAMSPSDSKGQVKRTRRPGVGSPMGREV